jgi:3',5'-cyclic AMP phosphodiesterase CpdA
MPGAELSIGGVSQQALAKPRATWCLYDLSLPAGESQLKVAPPDWDQESAYRFANMGDIQTAMDSVHEVFEVISQTPDLRFVMSTGDVTEKGERAEYTLFQEQLAALDIPFFSTIGNHELTTHIERWHTRFGRYSVHFRFKGIDFSFLDSGNAGLDPILYERLDGWLEEGKDRVHIFGTHYPPIDPIGVRNAGFRSRNEASMLLGRLARANIDLTLYGHIHSLYEFENAGMPAYISGGGGALPERLDGIDRHFLVIEADPLQNEIRSVEVVRVATP